MLFTIELAHNINIPIHPDECNDAAKLKAIFNNYVCWEVFRATLSTGRAIWGNGRLKAKPRKQIKLQPKRSVMRVDWITTAYSASIIITKNARGLILNNSLNITSNLDV